jgi:S-layer family protein
VSSISRRITALVAAIALTTALLPATALPVAAAGGSNLISVANGYRVDAGLAPVSIHAVVDQIAVERGRQLASAGALSHDFEYVKRRFAEEGICWRGFGEIIAYNSSGDYERFGQQWFSSQVHHDIMLGNYAHAGGSREAGDDGGYYAVMIFVKLCGAAPAPTPSTGFTDIGGSAFVSDIRWLVGEQITAGCAPDRYCPRSPVTREQMASFLKRATGIPASAVNAFVDDNSSAHESDINGVAAAQITAGCMDVRFCPGSVVTRGQMASFLARALSLPSATRDWYHDDNGTTHEGAINRLAEAGITGGCATGSFCPTAAVSREQMAGFLHRAFGN